MRFVSCFKFEIFECSNPFFFITRNDELARILERVVEIGLRGGWAEFQGTPLQIPRIQSSESKPPETR